MPPRFVYWTILIDNRPTAFRAREKDDLLPTLAQLRRTNPDVVMKYFAHGQLWESADAARESRQQPPTTEKRGRDWRPGGRHEDPRARFDKRHKEQRRKDQKPRPDPQREPWNARPAVRREEPRASHSQSRGPARDKGSSSPRPEAGRRPRTAWKDKKAPAEARRWPRKNAPKKKPKRRDEE